MDVQTIPIDSIEPAAYNPRKDLQPGDPEYARLERSLDEFGCVEPVVWNRRTGRLASGHQRFKFLKARGDTEVQATAFSKQSDPKGI